MMARQWPVDRRFWVSAVRLSLASLCPLPEPLSASDLDLAAKASISGASFKVAVALTPGATRRRVCPISVAWSADQVPDGSRRRGNHGWKTGSRNEGGAGLP